MSVDMLLDQLTLLLLLDKRAKKDMQFCLIWITLGTLTKLANALTSLIDDVP